MEARFGADGSAVGNRRGRTSARSSTSDKGSTMKRQPASDRSIKEPKLSRTHPPVDLAPVDWQRALRRQFGRDQAFVLENRGDQPFFSEFRVSNPQSKASYRVAIRGLSGRRQLLLLPRLRHQRHSAPASTSSSPWPGSRRSAARKAAFARGLSAAVLARSTCVTTVPRAVHFRAGSDCPPSRARAGRAAVRRRTRRRPAGERFGELRALPRDGGEASATSCAPTTMRSTSSPSRRDATRRARSLDEAVPARRGRQAAREAAQGAAVSDYQPEGALFAARAGRAPDRRRDGPGQDHPGHRGDGNHGAAFRRRARAGRLPDLAQAPVAERDRALLRPCRAGDGRRPGAAAEGLQRPTISSRSPTTTSCTPIST